MDIIKVGAWYVKHFFSAKEITFFYKKEITFPFDVTANGHTVIDAKYLIILPCSISEVQSDHG